MTALTASLRPLPGLSAARLSQASSMIFFCLSILCAALQAVGRLDAFFQRRDEGDTDVVPPRVPARGVAREEAAGQDEEIVVAVQAPGERRVVLGRADPEVEAAVGLLRLQVFQPRQHGGELLGVKAPVL